MTTFWILLCLYIIAIVINAIYQRQEEHFHTLNQTRLEAIAFQFWIGSFGKNGHPKGKNGSWMTTWELYEYWNSGLVDQQPWKMHVINSLKHHSEHKTKDADKAIKPKLCI